MSACRVCDAGPAGQRLHKCPNSPYYVPGSDPSAERRVEIERVCEWCGGPITDSIAYYGCCCSEECGDRYNAHQPETD